MNSKKKKCLFLYFNMIQKCRGVFPLYKMLQNLGEGAHGNSTYCIAAVHYKVYLKRAVCACKLQPHEQFISIFTPSPILGSSNRITLRQNSNLWNSLISAGEFSSFLCPSSCCSPGSSKLGLISESPPVFHNETR